MPTLQPVYAGQRVLVEMVFRLNGVPTDPSIVKAICSSPTGVVSTLNYPDDNLTRRDTGVYEAAVLVDEPGQWAVRGEGVGVVDAVNEHIIDVLRSHIAQ